MARPLYRIQQFLRALTARVNPEEWKLVAEILPEDAQALFRRMPTADQRHALNILYALRAQGYQAPALGAAALLHDVAKSEGVQLWHRVPVVFIRAIRPAWLARIASPNPHSWRYGFTLVIEHPRRGAKMAQAAGCSPDTVDLIRRHQDAIIGPATSQQDEWLLALHAVDDVN
jgi:hypothetical protein